VLILATAGIGNAILIEASLSFLGLGTPPPHASWGRELSGAGRQYFEIAPWMAVAPGAAIMLAVLGFNLLGDAIRDVFDPRLRHR
jgi:peptide/nickel transport system permease protein